MPTIHPTAVVDASARIAPSAVVGPYCVVGPEVVVGERTVLRNHVTLQALTTLGDDNQVYPFAALGGDPQDRKFQGERSWCVIGSRNCIREHVTIHRGTANGGSYTRIGDDNLIMVSVHIAHDCQVASHVTIANQTMLAGHVHIEEGANIGGGVGIHHYVTIGKCAFVGGMARVSKDVPPFMMVAGSPATVRAVNALAMMRRGEQPQHIEAVREAHRRLFREADSAAMSEKIDALRRDFADVEAVTALCDALVAAGDGVHGRARETNRSDDKRAAPAGHPGRARAE